MFVTARSKKSNTGLCNFLFCCLLGYAGTIIWKH